MSDNNYLNKIDKAALKKKNLEALKHSLKPFENSKGEYEFNPNNELYQKLIPRISSIIESMTKNGISLGSNHRSLLHHILKYGNFEKKILLQTCNNILAEEINNIIPKYISNTNINFTSSEDLFKNIDISINKYLLLEHFSNPLIFEILRNIIICD